VVRIVQKYNQIAHNKMHKVSTLIEMAIAEFQERFGATSAQHLQPTQKQPV
jgi:hypothetical protein